MLSALSKEVPKQPKTTGVDLSGVPMTGKCRSVGISTRESLIGRLENIRDELNIKSLNQVIVYALRHFCAKYDEGVTGIEKCVVIPKQVKASLNMGDDHGT